MDFLENMNFEIQQGAQKKVRSEQVSCLLKRGPVKVLNDAKMSPSKFLDNIEDTLHCCWP